MDDKFLNDSNTHQISFATMFSNACVFIGFSFFILSLFIPVFYTSAEDIVGYWVLFIGWIGGIFLQFAWYANPCNLLALLLAQKKPKIAFLLSVCALFLASGAFAVVEMPTGINAEKIFIKEFGLGLYIWYAAHVFFLLSLLSRFISSVKK